MHFSVSFLCFETKGENCILQSNLKKKNVIVKPHQARFTVVSAQPLSLFAGTNPSLILCLAPHERTEMC